MPNEMREEEPEASAVPDGPPVADTATTLRNESPAYRSSNVCVQRMSDFVTMYVDVANLRGL